MTDYLKQNMTIIQILMLVTFFSSDAFVELQDVYG